MSANKPKLKMTVRSALTLPKVIEQYHWLAKSGAGDIVRGSKVGFELEERDTFSIPMFHDAERVWLLYEEAKP